MTRIALCLFAAALLAGCGANSDNALYQSVGYDCSQRDTWGSEWLCSGSTGEGAVVSRYCYETLGRVNCFDRPDPDRKNQPLGSGS